MKEDIEKCPTCGTEKWPRLVGFSYHLTSSFTGMAGWSELTPLDVYMAKVEKRWNPLDDFMIKEALLDGYIVEAEYAEDPEAAVMKCQDMITAWARDYWEGCKIGFKRGLRG
jgi:predicted P-loop ATPase